MTQRDLDLARESFDLLESGGYEAMLPFVHPEFEMETPAALAAEPQRYKGVEGYLRWWSSFLEVMDEVTMEPLSFHDLGHGCLVVETRMRAVGSGSGIETTQEIFQVVTVRDEKIARIDFATSLEDAKAGRFA